MYQLNLGSYRSWLAREPEQAVNSNTTNMAADLRGN